MTATTPRKLFDQAVERMVDAVMAGDRAAAVRALGDAEAFLTLDVHSDAAAWVEGERARVDGVGDVAQEPRRWVK